MNALALINNFERDFSRPFFHRPARQNWLADFAEVRNNSFSSEMVYDEKSSTFRLIVELAGVTKENVKVDTDESHLQISGEKTKGLSAGKFEGRYALPEGIDEQKIEAAFEDGILTVTMPKLEKKLAKTIQIK